MANEICKAFLEQYRKIVGAKPEERINKRYKPYLAPDNHYYDGHCGHCAEVKYLGTIYSKDKERVRE